MPPTGRYTGRVFIALQIQRRPSNMQRISLLSIVMKVPAWCCFFAGCVQVHMRSIIIVIIIIIIAIVTIIVITIITT